MQILKSLKAMVTSGIVLSALSFHAAASVSSAAGDVQTMPACEGSWSLDVKTTSAVEERKGQRGVWIPATVYLDRNLAQCARELVIKPAQGGVPRLSGPRSHHDYELKNASRQLLPTINGDEAVMRLYGKASTNFWVYIPAAKDFSPGSYVSTLDLTLNKGNDQTIGKQVYSFHYQVKPYVRAKLASTNERWLKPSGTSVRVHLGDLTQSNRRDLPVFMESNGFVSMALSSQNKGNLVSVSNKRNKVPYQVMFAGKKVELVDDVVFDIGNRPFRQQKVTLSFLNKPEPYARAGQYEDVVTVSLFAR
ncbi:hypothetical protein [Enterovibrio baiacu]|uniref:hypothetical protein n=1 Tax=Enterovibrio baiacu TaxID=2491023 RepID=UPI003D0E7122